MNINNQKLLDQLKKIISNKIKIEQEFLTLNSSPITHVTWDSLANIQIYLEIQSQITNKLQIQDYMKCNNLKELYLKINSL